MVEGMSERLARAVPLQSNDMLGGVVYMSRQIAIQLFGSHQQLDNITHNHSSFELIPFSSS